MKLDKIKKDIERLSESKRQSAEALLEKAVWQDKKLAELQRHIDEFGWVENYRNGEHQSGRKKSAEADTYLSLSKVFNTTMKQLNDILTEVANLGADDELTAFLKGKVVNK